MGGCATKPKVLKGDEDLAPAPEPANIKEGYEAKEVVNEEEEAKVTTYEEEGAKNEEKVEAEGGDGEEGGALKVDDNGNKPRSLSNLFKESELEKESSGNGETTQTVDLPSEKHEENPKTETATTPVAEVESIPVVVAASEENPESIPVVVATSEEKPESIPVIVAASEEKPVTTAAVVQTGETENEKVKREEEANVVAVKDVAVTENAVEDDTIQEIPVLPASSAPVVAGEVTGSK